MARMNFLEALTSRTLVCDGAMGTQLMAAGLASGACGELWNVQNPQAVQKIHKAYIDSGCDLITTNTFGGTAIALARHEIQDQVEPINRQGARIACAAAGDKAYVLGDIGPTGAFLEPMGDLTSEQMTRSFSRQIEALAAGGVDAFIVETMQDPAEAALAISAAKKTGRPVIATFAFGKVDQDFRTMMGTTVKAAVDSAAEAGADVVGANCGTGLSLEDYRRLAEKLLEARRGAATILQPNAGSPVTIDGKLQYAATPEDMANLARELAQMGIRILGGCCGTTPAHLKAMASAVRGVH